MNLGNSVFSDLSCEWMNHGLDGFPLEFMHAVFWPGDTYSICVFQHSQLSTHVPKIQPHCVVRGHRIAPVYTWVINDLSTLGTKPAVAMVLVNFPRYIRVLTSEGSTLHICGIVMHSIVLSSTGGHNTYITCRWYLYAGIFMWLKPRCN